MSTKKLDLEKELSIRIEGELGRYNTLPIENLIKIAESLQHLINDIVKYDLPTDESIDLNNFKVELSGFHAGSAIPQFAFTKRIAHTVVDFKKQRGIVSEKLENIFEMSHTGTYAEIKKLYPDNVRRNIFVEDIYNLTTSFGNSPTSFGTLDKKGKFHSKYTVKKFKTELKNALISKITKQEIKEDEYALGRVKITTKGSKIRRRLEHVYDKSKTSLSFSPDVININGKQYILNYPLRCSFEQEENYFIIQYEQLDLIGTGLTEDEAEQSFYEEFDFLYTKLTSSSNKKLSKHLQIVKTIFENIVKSVENI